MAKKEAKKVKAEPVQQSDASEEATPTDESEWLENIIAIAIVAVVCVLAWGWLFGHWFAAGPQVTPPEDMVYEISTYDQPALGADNASVTIVEFSDYECPSCRWFHENLFPRLKADYIETGKVRFVYRDFPIETLHPDAFALAVVAECAREQGKFWDFHDAFYTEEMSDERINELAAELGADNDALQACRSDGRHQATVKADMNGGTLEGSVTATPTFFINGKKLVGSGTEEEFFAAVDSAVGNATA